MVTTMNVEELVNLGFTKNEAKVYISLIKFGRAKAKDLIRDTKFHKKLVYENIEKLIDKGIVSFVQEGRTRIFELADPNMLVEIIKEWLNKVLQEKESAQKIANEIRLISKETKPKQEATIFRGKEGIKMFYNELIKIGKDYVVFGAPQKSIEIMNELFWRNFNAKRIDKKINVRSLFNESVKEYGDSLKNKFTKIRYFEKNFEPLTETNIQDNRVGIIVWGEEPFLFLIEDKEVSKSYKEYFERMWKESNI